MMGFFKGFKSEPAWYLLLCFAFISTITMPLARIFLLASAICVASQYIRRKEWPHFSLPSKGWLIYVCVVFIVSIFASIFIKDPLLNPTKGLFKIDKLIWYIGIPLVALLVDSKERFFQIIRWFVVGCVITAIIVFITYSFNAWVIFSIPHPNEMMDESYHKYIPITSQWLYHITHFLGTYNDIWDKIRECFPYRPPSYTLALMIQGTMEDSQRLMCGMPAAFFLFLHGVKQGASRKSCIKYFAALLIVSLALVFTCKRGPLIASAIVMLPIAFYYFKRSTFLVVGLLLAFLLLIPAARMRMHYLSTELSVDKGGRYAMWTQIVPEIHEKYPCGIGFMSLTTEKMRELCPNMERRPHSHVHSTPLQIFVDLSWFGVVAHAIWVILSILPCMIFLRRGAGIYVVAPFAMLMLLYLFGLIEYNLADAEIVLLYSIAMGLSDCAFLNNCYSKKNPKA